MVTKTETETECVHHYKLPHANGTHVEGRCIKCNKVRVFKAFDLEDFSYTGKGKKKKENV